MSVTPHRPETATSLFHAVSHQILMGMNAEQHTSGAANISVGEPNAIESDQKGFAVISD